MRCYGWVSQCFSPRFGLLRFSLPALVMLVLSAAPVASAPNAPNAPQSPGWDGTWREVVTSSTSPAARGLSSAIEDLLRTRMVLFGGTDDFGGGSLFGDVWTLSLAEPAAWTQLFPAGTPPTPRLGHAAIYDPVRDRMIVWSGWDGVDDADEVWALSLSGSPAWTRIVPIGPTPVGRGASSLIYDPLRDRLVMFGGFHGFAHNDVWVLPLSGAPVWTQLTPSGTPPVGRGGQTALYDPIRDRMVVFGGSDEQETLNDVWALSLSGAPAWVALHPTGALPPARTLPSGVYDALRDRLVVYGGSASDSLNTPSLEDVWALSFANGLAWAQLFPDGATPRGRSCSASIYDGAGDAMVFFGGYDEETYLEDTWALDWGGPTHAPDTGSPSDASQVRLLCTGRNPAGPGDRIEISLEGPSAGGLVTLALYDVQGRSLGMLWDGYADAARPLWSGSVRDLPIRAAGRYLLNARTREGAFVHSLVVVGDGR